ncbi:transglutaminase-like domain-containing protein [Fusibacter ferrireducens]|uniref:Transglutaminase domain-containing protein n=1 Tax=Fusibacter ferrireducens TaxID=2785058 RepID=A0ABR9ZXJ3_9FIRM|nr:transglutaminase-like domain-containing protein [Fusibacter ferrireducens]MBF4695187.1 transglutaminase domain-containing protein [Fusibacter ferrireducens]
MDMNLEYLRVKCPEHIENLVKMGAFNQARMAIQKHMTLKIPSILKQRLAHELMTMALIEQTFVHTKSDLFEALSPYIVGLDLAELDIFEAEGYLLWHMIEGEKKYHIRAAKTLLNQNPNIEERLNLQGYKPAQERLREQEALGHAIGKMKSTGEMAVEMTIRAGLALNSNGIKKQAIPEIEVATRFYLPFPRKAHFTRSVKMLNASNSNYQIASEEALQRVVYFEGRKGEDVFEIQYKFLTHMAYRPIYEIAERLEQENTDEMTDAFWDATQVNLYGTLEKEAQEVFLKEKSPHILFTPLLVDLAHEIVGQEKHPLIKAKRIYDYITQHIRYRFMVPYRMLLNIPEYGALNMIGDCGVQSLLFITLLRIVGVPATFASGLAISPEGDCGMHDWSAFYIEPYGWCFADVSYGGHAYRKGLMAKCHFYFGNLDPYRMMSNFDFQEAFEFPKIYVRDDPYDNQVGEAETNLEGLYADDYRAYTQLVAIREVE